jgi:2-polyprenyl-3-methyl-5-hydroxy-6-metoxy-1,4-benzoquinol methylase
MRQDLKEFYDQKYAAGRELPRTSKQFAADCVPDNRVLEVLDVGCGSGANSLRLAQKGHRVHGVDVSEIAIRHYCSHGFDGRVADVEVGLDYPAASFDCVFCSEVIEHMTSPGIVASEMNRILKPGGLLVISTPNSAFWLYRLLGLFGYTVAELQHPKHFQFFSLRSLVKLLESTGLRRKKILGRNMYAILPDVPKSLANVLSLLGFQREMRFRTGKPFWHLSGRSSFFTSVLADTLILVMEKPETGSSDN